MWFLAVVANDRTGLLNADIGAPITDIVAPRAAFNSDIKQH
jgi:hypothetical protein